MFTVTAVTQYVRKRGKRKAPAYAITPAPFPLFRGVGNVLGARKQGYDNEAQRALIKLTGYQLSVIAQKWL